MFNLSHLACHRQIGGSNNKNILSQSSGGWKSEVKLTCEAPGNRNGTRFWNVPDTKMSHSRKERAPSPSVCNSSWSGRLNMMLLPSHQCHQVFGTHGAASRWAAFLSDATPSGPTLGQVAAISPPCPAPVCLVIRGVQAWLYS